ncbi:MAG: stage III sporulation protein AB [Lachnospiraceae bacterium]|nr:stage III sporulation protein AB [Lachnospiraceae bacterium]
MEYIRLIGAALIVFAGAGFGACPVHKMTERMKEMEELYFCLLRLKSEIRHGVKTLPESLKCAADSGKSKSTGRYRTVMKQMAKRMENGTEGYEVLVRESAEELLTGKVLYKEERDAFAEAFLLLGGGDLERQVQSLEYYAETVRLALAEEKQRKKERAYLYRSLGLLGGIFLSVILY